jgi:hypothetical protein
MRLPQTGSYFERNRIIPALVKLAPLREKAIGNRRDRVGESLVDRLGL